jgi:hypothetical protein
MHSVASLIPYLLHTCVTRSMAIDFRGLVAVEVGVVAAVDHLRLHLHCRRRRWRRTLPLQTYLTSSFASPSIKSLWATRYIDHTPIKCSPLHASNLFRPEVHESEAAKSRQWSSHVVYGGLVCRARPHVPRQCLEQFARAHNLELGCFLIFT